MEKKSKRMLTEEFNVYKGNYKKANGEIVPIAYIKGTDGDNTFAYNNEIKKRFGALWNTSMKAWVWYLNSDPIDVLYNKKIKPCMEFLMQREHTASGQKRAVVSVLDQLLQTLQQEDDSVETVGEYGEQIRPIFSKRDLEEKLKQYKQEMIDTVNSEEFQAKYEEIIKKMQLRRLGSDFKGWANAILILIQKPDATLVKSGSNWKDPKFNRKPKKGARPIWLYVPQESYGIKRMKEAFLAELGKESLKQLTDEEKAQYNEKVAELKSSGIPTKTFPLRPNFYDKSDTELIDGKEGTLGDLSGNGEWFNNSGEETERMNILVTAIETYGNELLGLNLGYEHIEGDARGYAAGEKIRGRDDAKVNASTFHTWAHEIAHAFLHQKYLQSKFPELKSFFVGCDQGSGVVEQQAELCSWIVCRYFDCAYDEYFNYTIGWGADKKTMPIVFDMVSNVANQIIAGVEEFSKKAASSLNTVSESVIRESANFTGFDVAKMLGMEQEYLQIKKGLEQEQAAGEEMMQEERNKFFGWMQRLDESR